MTRGPRTRRRRGAAPGARTGAGPEGGERSIRRALWLLGATSAYNVVEAALAVWAGVAAGSVALMGFGLDSVIELTASLVVLWRFRVEWRGGDAGAVTAAESRVRKLVGATFFLLAGYVLVEAGLHLAGHARARESALGIGIAAASLVLMPALAAAKLRTAGQLDSDALRAEAKETLACSYLSLTLLLGLGATAWLGWWWADPAAALLMVPWLVREGMEGIRDDGDD